jgi:hypothetical protein
VAVASVVTVVTARADTAGVMLARARRVVLLASLLLSSVVASAVAVVPPPPLNEPTIHLNGLGVTECMAGNDMYSKKRRAILAMSPLV